MKGGCAKTVTTYNLAYSLQKLGKKVLAVDFDSQANLTTCFGVEDPAAAPVTAPSKPSRSSQKLCNDQLQIHAGAGGSIAFRSAVRGRTDRSVPMSQA